MEEELLQTPKNEMEDNDKMQKATESLQKRGQEYRLHELVQQLEIAETRCDTLKQQIDYMKSLYHGVQQESHPKDKQRKDHSKRKTLNKNKTKRSSPDLYLEEKLSELSYKTSDKITQNISNTIKNSPRYATTLPNKENISNRAQIIDFAERDNYDPGEGDTVKRITHEVPIRDLGACTTASIHADSSINPHIPVNENVINQDNEHDMPHTATEAIKNVLSGVSDSVNRISQLNVYINDDKEDFPLGSSQGELSLQNKLYFNQDQLTSTVKDEIYAESFTKTGSKDTSKYMNENTELNNHFKLNSCSDSHFEQIYNKNLNRIKDDGGLKRKHNRTRLGKRELPSKLPTNNVPESNENIQSNKRKGKAEGKHKEKRQKGLGPYINLDIKSKSEISDEVISVTTKLKKKRNKKLKFCNSNNATGYISEHHEGTQTNPKSREAENDDSLYSPVQIPYKVWCGDNIIELYHNTSMRPDTSISEENFTRYSCPSKTTIKSMQIYPGIQNQLHGDELQGTGYSKQHENHNIREHDNIFEISDETVTEGIRTETVTQKVYGSTSDEKMVKTPDRPQTAKEIPMLNNMMPSENVCRARANSESQSYSLNARKNFQSPTLSSKMKQVNRNYGERFNFHNIPFVAATSTSPSHNLGLNIQQVLSIIKMRQPVRHLSSGLMNHQFCGQNPCPDAILRSQPFSPADHKSVCPAIISENICELPEKDCIEMEKNHMENSECPSRECGNSYNGWHTHSVPPFHEKVKHNSTSCKTWRSEDRWVVEQDNENKVSKSNLRCGCFPTRQCIHYETILKRYLKGGEKLSFLRYTPPERLAPCRTQPLQTHLNQVKKIQNDNLLMHNIISGQSQPHGNCFNELSEIQNTQMKALSNRTMRNKSPNFVVDIQGREKNLKDVLTNLQNDFKRLNRKYEELQTRVTQDCIKENEAEALKQVEDLEAELQAKEDEIIVVMALYKEVMLLKGQVKALREHASRSNFNSQSPTKVKVHRILIREPTVAVRLTKLLRTIQQFQAKLKED